MFAFFGIESSLTPSGEVRNPARTVPRAIYLALGLTTVIYILIQLVAQGGGDPRRRRRDQDPAPRGTLAQPE